MNQSEWLADIGKAADDLGYGIATIGFDYIDLIARQDDVEIRVTARRLSGDMLRERLAPIPHHSGSYTENYQRLVIR